MGASAAVILSLTHALVNYCDHVFSADKYLYFGREIENLQHGKSSGLDLFLSYPFYLGKYG
jgi:mevalonate kinase